MELRQIDAGDLNVGYVEGGSSRDPVVILLHGWPYDIHCFDDVIPLLASNGYRAIAPYLRGYGTTRFRSKRTFRSGEQVVFAVDTVALMDALRIESAIVAGFDWGARAADILGALWPERCSGLVPVSGYLIVNLRDNQNPLPPRAELAWWYQYYFSTERGRVGYGEYRRDFNKLIWKLASPAWRFDDGTYGRTATAFDNDDHVDIVIHNYRWRLQLAQGDPRYALLEHELQRRPRISVPTITIASDFDGRGVGHNVPQEAPKAFSQAIFDLRTLT